MKPRRSSHTPQFGTIFVFAAFCILGIVLLQSGKPSDRSTAWICIGLFGSMTVLSAAWEVARNYQGEATRWQTLKIEGVERKVWFFPASKLQQWFLAATMLCIGGTVGSIFLLKSALQGWEMAIAGVLALSAALSFIYAALTKTRGIALLPSGVLWLKEKTPVHMPWVSVTLVTATKVAQDVGHGFKTHLPALGIRLKPDYPQQISELPSSGRRLLTKRTHNKLLANKTQTNFELTYLDEALVIPVEEAARLLAFFLENPRDRRELNPEQTGLGFIETLLRTE